ncbi:MAG: succinoglycan biosynthesis protein ExoM [Microbacteriaceae bacterium]|jgi:glycosyltransferase involved in cell wall biosynthesis|nr:succinoglycan biosynthesis protein ExoM [Microbacteriaceae bacterium]
MAQDARVKVTIALPTYRRPEKLRGLLPMLTAQADEVRTRPGSPFDVELLVVDNDSERSGEDAAREAADPHLRYVVEPTPGISAARNRAMDESVRSNVLVFMDDDELPRDGWLEHLLQVWQETRPAAVSGRVVVTYEGTLDPWIAAGGFFRRRTMPTGTEIRVASTNSILLDLDQVRRIGVRFAADLGLTGGSDTLFSRQLVRGGGRIVWCDESVVDDLLPAIRMTRRWVLKRARRHGNTASIVEIRMAAGGWGTRLVRARECTRGAVRIVGGGARFLFGAILRSRTHEARGLRVVYRGAGMIAGATGVIYQEYAR